MNTLMKIVLAMTAAATVTTAAHAQATINGAGASFPYPVYSQWAYKYNQLTGLKLNYQSIGSGGGIAQIKAKTVDFGASDAPLEVKELDAAGLIQFPLVMGGVVPVINLKGVKSGDLKLTPELLSGIFLGTITKWNDQKIAAVNPGLSLSSTAITVVHRSDGSGTTWIFTNYLDKISPEWHKKVGVEKSVSWPVGVGGKGNEGIAAYVQRINGSIGYVEYAYALQNKLPHVLMKNKAGAFVAPTIDTFQSAAANADWTAAPGFYMVLTDQPGEKSWPITGASFILIHKQQQDAAKALAMLTFFDWCFNHGSDIASQLHYVPMPANVVTLVEAAWKTQIAAGSTPVWKK
jgi:phosphate transport system substrate-binding protein